MNRLLRLFGLLALCFALVAGSMTMAVARGHATALSRGGVTLILCSGLGYRTVSLDVGGNPIGPLHPCPDCLAGLAAYIAPEPVLLAPRSVITRMVAAVAPPTLQPLAAPYVPRARGPPLVV